MIKMKHTESFYRYKLIELGQKAAECPILFSAIYQHSHDPKWISLNAIRLLSDGSRTICSHINLSREAAAKQLDLSPSLHQRKMIFLAQVESYSHFGSIRGGLKLMELEQLKSLWLASTAAEDLMRVEAVKKAVEVYG